MFDTAPSDSSTKRQRRWQTCHDAVPQLLAKGQLEAAKSICRRALEEFDSAKPGIADVWYSLGLVHDIAHEHEEVERCMRKACDKYSIVQQDTVANVAKNFKTK